MAILYLTHKIVLKNRNIQQRTLYKIKIITPAQQRTLYKIKIITPALWLIHFAGVIYFKMLLN